MKNALLNKRNSGFTLIELLVVIAVLGILAAVVLVAINPIEQFRRARDSGRKSAVSQLGNAMESYYTARAGSASPTYMAVNAAVPAEGWITTLANAGELKASVIGSIPANSDCSLGAGQLKQAGVCYSPGGAATAYIWTNLESQSDKAKCPTAAAGDSAVYYWGSDNGRACIVCVGPTSTNAAIDAANEACSTTQ